MLDLEVRASHFILHTVLPHPLDTLWVEIVTEHVAAFLCCRDGEWPNTGHDVRDDLAWWQDIDQAIVLPLEARVPVDLGKVECECTAGFVLPSVRIRGNHKKAAGEAYAADHMPV